MRFLAALTLLPLAANAQASVTSDQANGTTKEVYIGHSACVNNNGYVFRWDLGAGNPAAGATVEALHVRSTSTCGAGNATSPDFAQQASSQAETGTDVVHAADLVVDSSDAGLPGACANTDRPSSSPWATYYCIEVRTPGSLVTGATNSCAGCVTVKFATAPPTPPIGIVITAGDQHLKVDWTAGNSAENLASYDVHVLLPDAGFDPTRLAKNISAPGTTADVNTTDNGAALQDDQPYVVQVVANDVYGNVSSPADGGLGTPKHILDFYNLYRDEGGNAEGHGGCSSSGAATWIGLAILATGLIARRRKGAALIASVALLAPAARADRRAADRPARWLLVALKIDRYDPKIDSEAGLTGNPYHQIFGPRAPLRWQLEVDWEVAHPFGSLLIGATAGYWQNFGHGLTADTRAPSGDTALIDVLPFGVIATYRFDWLADRWVRFPVIPYAQVGLQRALWASFNGTGAVSKDATSGSRGSGWTYGYTTALGIALSLDSIDPDLAREAYVDAGIQRTSLFAEYGWTRLDNFAKGNALILTDRAWRFGLAMEF
ncbi:MAG: MXAN_2562 family outer membrane beta-barrel protein [Myxococcales bacterium]|nr:hypothetical protein [Myxococcales bacterium]